MSGIRRIESEVPFGRVLAVTLQLNQIDLRKEINHDPVQRTYLAWETVRKESNPYFTEGTGFEGYFVGRCSIPETALEAILGINQHILDAITRMYRYQYKFRSTLMKTLMREASDFGAIHVWSAYFGAELGRLRAQIFVEPEAQEFQLQTYRIINMLPPMIFCGEGDSVRQTYAIGALPTPKYHKVSVNAAMLNPSQRDAWLVAENIGIFGHPLVRKFLDRVRAADYAFE